MMNIVNGGAHADNAVDVQEFMVMPLGFTKFSDALRAGVEMFHHLKRCCKAKKLNTNVGDEGGFAPDLRSNAEALDLIVEAIQKAGYKPGEQIAIALDVAAHGAVRREDQEIHGRRQVDSVRAEWSTSWPAGWRNIPSARSKTAAREDDWEGWKMLSQRLGDKVQLVGDDLFVTNTKRLQRGIDEQIANSILIKVNQIGTLTETIEAFNWPIATATPASPAIAAAKPKTRTIADLAVALGTGQIKTGSASRTDRMAKYNQLLRIEEELGDSAVYAGPLFRRRAN